MALTTEEVLRTTCVQEMVYLFTQSTNSNIKVIGKIIDQMVLGHKLTETAADMMASSRKDWNMEKETSIGQMVRNIQGSLRKVTCMDTDYWPKEKESMKETSIEMKSQAKEKCVPNMGSIRVNLSTERCKEKANFIGMMGKFIEEDFEETKCMDMEP